VVRAPAPSQKIKILSNWRGSLTQAESGIEISLGYLHIATFSRDRREPTLNALGLAGA
jgi:hypothetical protein